MRLAFLPAYVADCYSQRAGAGLIITEATNIWAQARGYRRTPGNVPVAPSAVTPSGQIRVHDGMKGFVAPRALRADEIPAIVDDYRRAAVNAKTAGFDGVEVHSANNYLLEQFIRTAPIAGATPTAAL